MKAAKLYAGNVTVHEVPLPVPCAGEVLVQALASGVCGSDLSLWASSRDAVARGIALPSPAGAFLGHEFCAEIVDYGPDTARGFALGTRVVSVPALLRDGKLRWLGEDPELYGGFSEYLSLTERFVMAVPDGVSDAGAALVEPLAVAFHAVESSGIHWTQRPLIVGCGPIGLAVVVALHARGVERMLVVDPNAARVRVALTLARRLRVEAVPIDYSEWARALSEDGHGDIEALFPDAAATCAPPIAFECAGRQGVINEIMRNAPNATRIMVLGLCRSADEFQPSLGVLKQLQLHFVVVYNLHHYRQALAALAADRVPIDVFVTSCIGLDQLPGVMEALQGEHDQIKVVVGRNPERYGR